MSGFNSRLFGSTVATLLGLLTIPAITQAALTAPDDKPLSSATTGSVLPNIMFLLDDSGSMKWDFMPDDQVNGNNNPPLANNAVGLRNSSCNLIYYNPAVSYVIPKDATGANLNNSGQTTFTAAITNGYYSYMGQTKNTVNLSTSFRAQSILNSGSFPQDTAQAAHYWVYLGSSTLNPSNPAGDCGTNTSSTSTTLSDASATGICNDGTIVTNSPASCTLPKTLLWKKTLVSSTSGAGSTDERQNFANWYTYYRTRIMMMKAAGSRSFYQILPATSSAPAAYRVGFITINTGSPVGSSKFMPIADFKDTGSSTNATNWFNKLFSQSTNGSTPTLQALSRVGRYYANKTDGINSGMSDDPIQYSCQQNFTILVTDGYWNGSSPGVLDVSGSDVGGTSQDSDVSEKDAYNSTAAKISVSPRPIYDGLTATTTTTTLTFGYRNSTSSCSSGKQIIQYRPIYTTNGTSSNGSYTKASWLTPNCVNSSSLPALPTSSAPNASASPFPSPPSGCSTPWSTSWTCDTTATAGGSTTSLADVAQYFYKTDLRNGSCAKCTDNVPSNGTTVEDDLANWQHMTTFTMALGLSGTLNYTADYKSTGSTNLSDFPAIRSGAKNWPTPSANGATALDDIWHAAVNGRGQYFSAGDPDSVIDNLSGALSGINARTASAAAAATSNLEPVAGDNFVYTAKYMTAAWSGELEAHEIDLTTGQVKAAVIWSAQTKLDNMTGAACDNRTIKLFRSGASNNLTDFSWNTSACDTSGIPTGTAATGLNASEQGYFSSTQVATLSQYPNMTNGTSGTVDQRSAAAGANLVNFVRGQRGKEGFVANDLNQLYRENGNPGPHQGNRAHVLGDIINAQPVYVKAPPFSYDDTGYSTFKSASTRAPMVYVAANDGMLHAFYAGTSTTDTQGGVEAWGFIPSSVLPNLYNLANENYWTSHRYFVDGTPTVGDVYNTTSSTWKTILVAGLNKGGKGYYALDITDPTTPKGLWEFNWSSTCYDASNVTTHGADCHIGYTYSNPVITKLADGTWVVLVTSGYDNVNSPAITGDGQGYLYVLNAITGKIIYKIGTGAGSSTTPSGLNHISAWVESPLRNNTTTRVYSGDLLGNIWRFDINDTIAPSGREATLLATVVDTSGIPQPISTRPELATVNSQPYVYVGTGKYLSSSSSNNDLTNNQKQSIYAIKDPLTSTAVTDLRNTLRQMTITNVGSGSSQTRTIACTAQCSSDSGWYVDLPDPTSGTGASERVNIDMKLQLGTLVVASNVPTGDNCNIGGYSWLNYFDFATGNPVATTTIVGKRLSESLAVGLNIVRLPDGKTVVITTTSDAKQTTNDAAFDTPPPTGKRVSWREIY